MGSDDPSKISKSSVYNVEDLWFEIFKRFPVKTLCRFRCVCKSWNSLISSPLFIAHQFSSTATAATDKPHLLVNGRQNTHKPYALYRPQEPLHQQITYLDFPLPARNCNPHPRCGSFSIIDVINGVVCFAHSFKAYNDSALLWNPSIRKYVDIPWSPFRDSSHISRCRIGFGFDSSRNDFRVVRISYPFRGVGLPVCEVFSLQDGLWREVAADNVGAHERVSVNSCFINGTIHWITTKSKAPEDNIFRYALLLFDCEREEFRTMELPQELGQVPLTAMDGKVFSYGGMLAVLRQGDVCELWVMKKCGEVSTWNKLFRIERLVGLYSTIMLGKHGDVFVCDDVATLAPRNPTKNTLEHFRRLKFYQPVNGYVFVESLFLLEQKKPSPDVEEKLGRPKVKVEDSRNDYLNHPRSINISTSLDP